MALPAFDYVPPKYTGISYEKCLELRQKHCSTAAFLVYRDPLMIVNGKM
jgi:alanine-glyoxylate transaminase/(R)-3-amino-2-methylpropionate-pyruvate transaminase